MSLGEENKLQKLKHLYLALGYVILNASLTLNTFYVGISSNCIRRAFFSATYLYNIHATLDVRNGQSFGPVTQFCRLLSKYPTFSKYSSYHGSLQSNNFYLIFWHCFEIKRTINKKNILSQQIRKITKKNTSSYLDCVFELPLSFVIMAYHMFSTRFDYWRR